MPFPVVEELGRIAIDLLLHNAPADRVTPMYAFYNAWKKPPTLQWNCRTFARSPQLLGCAISPAASVRPLLKKGARGLASKLASLSLPWSCLVCCQGFTSGGTLPERVASVISNIWPPGGGEGEFEEFGNSTFLLEEAPPTSPRRWPTGRSRSIRAAVSLTFLQMKSLP